LLDLGLLVLVNNRETRFHALWCFEEVCIEGSLAHQRTVIVPQVEELARAAAVCHGSHVLMLEADTLAHL